MTRNVAGSRLLINEYPLQVLPSLAVAIGLNEAIFIQQVHYWLVSSKHEHDGRTWIYNTLDEWQKQFPFWSISTLRRTIDNLRAKGILLTGNYNDTAAIRTLWYSIDYTLLDSLDPSADFNIPSAQDEQMEPPNMDSPSAQNGQMLIEQRLTAETTQRSGGGVATSDKDAAAAVKNHRGLSAEQREYVAKLEERGYNAGQARTAVIKQAFSLELIDRLDVLAARLEEKGKNPVAIIWPYLAEGKLPKDLPPSKASDWKPRKADGSIDYDRWNALIAQDRRWQTGPVL